MENVVGMKKDELGRDLLEQAKRGTEARRRRMSKDLGLPPLLERRRQEQYIIDECFQLQPVFDRVLVYQLPEQWMDGGKTEGGIHIPDSYAEKRVKESNRGVLISAGALATEQLISNGIEVGHIVSYLFFAPYSVPVARLGGGAGEVRLTVLRAGDILASEDLAMNLRSGKVKLQLNKELMQMEMVDSQGYLWTPRDAKKGDDY